MCGSFNCGLTIFKKWGNPKQTNLTERGKPPLCSQAFPVESAAGDDTFCYWDGFGILVHLHGATFSVVRSFLVTCSRNKSSFSDWGESASEASGISHESARLSVYTVGEVSLWVWLLAEHPDLLLRRILKIYLNCGTEVPKILLYIFPVCFFPSFF